MGKVKDYPNDGTLSSEDKLFGTDSTGLYNYNYKLGAILGFIAASLGATIRLVVTSSLPNTLLPDIDANTSMYIFINDVGDSHTIDAGALDNIEGFDSLVTLDRDSFIMIPEPSNKTWYII